MRRQLSVAKLKAMNPHRVIVSVRANGESLDGVTVMTTRKLEMSHMFVNNQLPKEGFSCKYKCKVVAEEASKGTGEGRFTIMILDGPDSIGEQWGFNPWDQIWCHVERGLGYALGLFETTHRIEVGDELWVVWEEEEEEEEEEVILFSSSSSAPLSTVPAPNDKDRPPTDAQKTKRREKNREHAKQSRIRKKSLFEGLQEQVKGLQSENETLKSFNSDLRRVKKNKQALIAMLTSSGWKCEHDEAHTLIKITPPVTFSTSEVFKSTATA